MTTIQYPGNLIRAGYTDDNAEQVTSLSTNDPSVVVLSIDLGELQVGDFLFGNGYFQGTKTANYNIGIACQLTLGTSPTDTGAEISEANGYSIIASVNHNVYRAIDMAVITNPSRHYLNFIARSYSDAGSDPVAIDQDYGSLGYMLYRKQAPALTNLPLNITLTEIV